MVLGEKRKISEMFIKNQGKRVPVGIQRKEYIII